MYFADWFRCAIGVALSGKDLAVNQYDRKNRDFQGGEHMVSFATRKNKTVSRSETRHSSKYLHYRILRFLR